VTEVTTTPGVRGAVTAHRPFLPLYAGILTSLLGIGASLGAMPLYVSERLGGTTVQVGAAVAAVALAAVVARPLAGRLADARGHKPVMVGGILLCAATGALYALATTFPLLMAVRLLHGVGEAAVYTAGAAWLVAICPAERRGRVVGLFGIFMWTGITAGALVGVALAAAAGYGAVWLFLAAVPLVGLAAVAAAPAPPRPEGPGGGPLLARSVWLPGAALSLASFGYAGLAGFAVLHLAARDVAGGIAAFNAFGVTYIGVRLVVGGWPDRFGAARVALWSAVVEAVGLAVVALAPNLAVAVVGGLVIGAGLSLLFPALALLVINATPEARRGSALGAFTSFWDLGIAVGAPVAGAVAALLGLPAVFWVGAAAAGLSAALAAGRARAG
jgi:MFS family permease